MDQQFLVHRGVVKRRFPQSAMLKESKYTSFSANWWNKSVNCTSFSANWWSKSVNCIGYYNLNKRSKELITTFHTVPNHFFPSFKYTKCVAHTLLASVGWRDQKFSTFHTLLNTNPSFLEMSVYIFL